MKIDKQSKYDFYILAVVGTLLAISFAIIINADKISAIINHK